MKFFLSILISFLLFGYPLSSTSSPVWDKQVMDEKYGQLDKFIRSIADTRDRQIDSIRWSVTDDKARFRATIKGADTKKEIEFDSHEIQEILSGSPNKDSISKVKDAVSAMPPRIYPPRKPSL